ncbi:sulfatase-like hydrolase/transferase [Clostridium lundense]|uniref:sulfatase-like hydrolase/transferase n=1 Tax=Clostridium lundense TaxID=319475 RepID=UPI000485CC69|nr:sulfatase-like hydrolase/transferase [Clostridium lundense]
MTLEKFGIKISGLKKIKLAIEESILKGEYDEAKNTIKEYEEQFPFDMTISTIKAALYVYENNLDEGERVLLEALKELPFNYEINYNLGMIYGFKLDFIKSLIFYFKALKYSKEDAEREMVVNSIDELSKIVINNYPNKINEFKNKVTELNAWVNEVDARSFPVNGKGESLIGKFLNEKNKDNGYYVNLYKVESLVDLVPQIRTLYKTEMLHGKIVDRTIDVEVKEDVVVPISTTKLSEFIFKINDKKFVLNNLLPNSFHYMPVRESGKLTIESNNEFFLGNIIKLKDEIKENKPKLIMYLFIDGLSQETIARDKLKKLMPKTYEFFNDGIRFNNCYCNGEWTLPGLATFFTGEYTTNHKLFHSEFTYKLGSKEKLMSEIFKEDGYFTTQICNDWRKTPLYGYNKGFDRSIYQPAVDGMGCEEVVMETIEHLQAFDEKNNFMWLSFGDLHKVADNIEPKISSQIKGSLYSRTVENDSNETVFKDYDEKKIERYEMEINRLDFYLGILYDYINSIYSKEEVLILLISDHGQTFLKKDTGFFHEGRTRVPLLIKGIDLQSKSVDDIIENVDVLPTVLKLLNINYNLNIDGKLPVCLGGESKREFAYTESIFPGQTYKAVINDYTHRFVFESENFVENDGRVEVGNFKVNLINKKTGHDEKDKFKEIVERYLEVVFNHIKKNIKI